MNEKCQVFTPSDYVEDLLDCVGYIEDLYDKKILENSCGDGNILICIVRRYIEDSITRGISQVNISEGLSRDIYGIEIDVKQYHKCIQNLDSIITEYDIHDVEWNIVNDNYLNWNEPFKFDFVVGNPPYITYKEIDEDERIALRECYLTCLNGKFDYCYAFVEKSISHLNENGRMSYLIPSSIFKTVFGQNLRDYIKPYVIEIKDYTHEKMFDDALVKSAIMVISNAGNQNEIRYKNMTTGHSFIVASDNLKQKWFFSEKVDKGEYRFGDYFSVSHVVATLYNDAFVLKGKCVVDGDYIIHDGVKIEKELVRKTMTPRSIRYNKGENIIFPYGYEDGKLVNYSVDEFEKKFPFTTKYLNGYRKRLDERNKDSKAKWFEYGRSQALANINYEKLLISTVITNSVAVHKLEQGCIPYAGMFIASNNADCKFNLNDAIKILSSAHFMKYVVRVGIHINGNSLRITSKDIANYTFMEV